MIRPRALRSRHSGGSPRGQTLVEFALVMPIFLMLLIGIFDLGRVVWANDTLASAAREGVRYAIVHGGSELNPCPVGPAALPALVPAPSTDCPYPSPSRQSVKDVVSEWLIGLSSPVTVSVCYGVVDVCVDDTDGPAPGGAPNPADNRRGTPVTVTVSASVDLAAPGLFGVGPFDLSATSTMLVNH